MAINSNFCNDENFWILTTRGDPGKKRFRENDFNIIFIRSSKRMAGTDAVSGRNKK